MRPQLACGKLSMTCLSIPQSHVSVVAGNGLLREVDWRRFVLHVGRCRLHQSKARRVMSSPFAALGRNEGVEFNEQLGLKGEGVGRGEEGLVSSVGTPSQSLASFRDWYMADKQLVVISFSAFVTVGFMSILLAAAIPSLIAIKKAAEALEKLADTAREELPGTMAAIRLSGMEISDLTMELNDLGRNRPDFKKQARDFQGVKSSARALNAAESGMRQVGGLASNETDSRSSASNAAAGGSHRKTND